MTKFDSVLDEAIVSGRVESRDRNLVSLEATRYMHMAGDAGRPSDAMRSTVRHYERVGRDEFLREAASLTAREGR